MQEARAASALNHPHIVTIHEIESEGGVDFIVMELVAGRTLRTLIPRQGLPIPEVLRIAIPWPTRWPPPTPRASCTATSSPRT